MLTFHVNPDLAGYKMLFEPNFYNTYRFIQHQRYNPLISFYILDETAKDVFAMIHFTMVDELAISLPKSPFGGFEYDASIAHDTWINFVRFCELELKRLKLRKIVITEAPGIYRDERISELSDILISQRFKMTITDLNHFVSLEEIDGIKQLHSMERRNFRKSLAKNYKWKLESNDALPEVYSFIERCREQQDLKVNISFVDIVRAFKVFPGKYRIMSVRHHGYLAAVTITVDVSKNILYNYLPASDKRFNQDSPMVFLMVNLYKYAKSLNYQILDLGVSSINGKIQSSLAEFKERMGAQFCNKNVFEKHID